MRVYYFKNTIDLPWGEPIEDIHEIPDSTDLTFLISNSHLNLNNPYEQIIISKNDISTTDSKNETIDKICERIRAFEAVHAFGDSHSIITHKIKICRENWLGFNTNYPITMNRFGKEGLDLHECVKKLGNGHEKYPIRPNDWALYFYGEIDIRYLILNQVKGLDPIETNYPDGLLKHWIKRILLKRSLDAVLNKLIENYLKRIKWNETAFHCKSIVFAPLPPVKNTEPSVKYTGSLNQRIDLHELFTNKLFQSCQLHGIAFISINDQIIGDDKTINPAFLKKQGDIHLDDSLYSIIRDEIMKKIINN